MSEYKLKTERVGEVVVGAYKKIEDGFVDRFLEEVETESEINTAEAEATDRAE